MKFRYSAIQQDGIRAQGEISSESLDAAVNELQGQGLVVINLGSAEIAVAKKNSESVSDRLALVVEKITKHVPTSALVFFTRQLATMFSAGMTVEKALDNLCINEQNARLKKILVQIANDIRKGLSLSDAMGKHPAVFNKLYVALIKSGEVAGTLHETLERLAEYLERTEEIKRRVVSAMVYPAVVLSILAIAVAFLVLVVAPKFNKVYQSFGAELPGPTMAVMTFSKFLVENAFAGLLLAFATIIGLVVFSQTDQGRELLDRLKLRIPVIGSLISNSITAKFARTFGLLMSTSVPVLDSLNLVAQVVSNVVTEKAVHKARDLIKEGKNIHAALQSTLAFPAVLIQLVSTGEETGEIDKLLLKAAEYYEKQVDAIVNRLASLIEPLLIVLMAGVVGTLVIVIYLPIFYLGMAMKKGMK